MGVVLGGVPDDVGGDLDRFDLVVVQQHVHIRVHLPGIGSGVFDAGRQASRDALVNRAGTWAHDKFAVDEAHAYWEIFRERLVVRPGPGVTGRQGGESPRAWLLVPPVEVGTGTCPEYLRHISTSLRPSSCSGASLKLRPRTGSGRRPSGEGWRRQPLVPGA